MSTNLTSLFSAHRYVEENQFVTLPERILVMGLKVVAFVSFVTGLYYFPRLLLGPLPPTACAGITLFTITGEFFITATHNELFFFRILLSFVWKNVGTLDDSLIMRFLLVANSILAGHFAAGHYLVDSYKKPFYIICVGANPNRFEETAMPAKASLKRIKPDMQLTLFLPGCNGQR